MYLSILIFIFYVVQASDTQSDEDGAPRFYGHSDRRGVINKATKLFTRDELSEMLRKLKDDGPKGDHIPLLSGGNYTGCSYMYMYMFIHAHVHVRD